MGRSKSPQLATRGSLEAELVLSRRHAQAVIDALARRGEQVRFEDDGTLDYVTWDVLAPTRITAHIEPTPEAEYAAAKNTNEKLDVLAKHAGLKKD